MGDTTGVWGDLRARSEIECMLCALPAGVRAIYARSEDGHRAILINRALSPIERLTALAHELVHDERGGGCHHPDLPDRMRPLVARDEARVDRIVAQRLLPLDRLAPWVSRTIETGEGVTADDVAREWDVTPEVAALALDELARRAA